MHTVHHMCTAMFYICVNDISNCACLHILQTAELARNDAMG